MAEYILFSKGKERFDNAGRSLGIGKDRAVYYAPKFGRGRIYRNAYPQAPQQKGAPVLALLTFGTKDAADKCCIAINEMQQDSFEAIEYGK